jgi:tetratricopeptide (TPR) repeat protein
MLRTFIALQPQHQAAWLWLSAITASQVEAKDALAQARKIDPAHPSLPKAEQWLAERFSAGPTPQKREITNLPAAPTPSLTTALINSPDPATARGAASTAETPFVPRLVPGLDRTQEVRLAGLGPTISLPPAMHSFYSGYVDLLNLLPGPQILKNRLRSFNALVFGSAILVVMAGLLILFLGLVREIQGTALAGEPGSNSIPQDKPVVISKEQPGAAKVPPASKNAEPAQDWARVVAVLEKLYQLKPDSAAIKTQLAEARFQKGLSLRSQGFVEGALTNFERASELLPEQVQIQQEVELASTYLAAIQYYQTGQWSEAVAGLEMIWVEDKAYPHIEDLLFSAYYNQALALQAADKLAEAKAALEAALALHPELSEPRRLLAEIEFALAPQTPLKSPISMTPIQDRTIVVSIAEQRMVVYEGDKQVFDFVVSTGEPGRDTAVGEFEILNKIDNAYASTWNLDMPYWLGIYWAGPLQNGIHALPIVKHTGYKLWDGYLGQRVSYGCVILSDEDAAKLYGWAEVGTKVKIVPSLAYWSPDD